MKKYPILVFVVLLCFLVETEVNFAQTPVDLGVLNGNATKLVKPEYPETAEKSAVGGEVKVSVTVDEQGNVIKAEAIFGELLLRDVALAAALASKFTPYLVNGKAAKMRGFLVFNFSPPSAKTPADNDKAKSAQTFDDLVEMDFKLLTNEVSIKEVTSKASTDDDYAKLLTRCGTGAGAGGKTSDQYEAVIKVCTEGIERFKTNEGVTNFYYYRGLARYLRVRQVTFDESQSGKFKSFTEFLSKFLATATKSDRELVYKASSDFSVGLSSPSSRDLYKNGHLYEAEMLSLMAFDPDVVSDREGYAAKAREAFSKAEKTAADKTIVANTRLALENELTKQKSAAEAQSRYKQLAIELSNNNNAYTRSVQTFQAVLQAQQSAATPNSAAICEALTTMNINFQKVGVPLGSIIKLMNNGELKFLPAETLKQLADNNAETTAMQTKIKNAAEHFGCKIN